MTNTPADRTENIQTPKPLLYYWLNGIGIASIIGGVLVALFVAGSMKSMTIFYLGLGIATSSLPAFATATIIGLLFDIKERLPEPNKSTIP